MQNFRSAPSSEYLPDPSETNDSPGSEASRQAWATAKARAVAEHRKTPYDLREQVCLCNDAGLTDFSKLLFCRLTDMAFKDAFKRGDGTLACSKKFLADDFDCSVDTITRATRALEKSGFIWTKTIWTGSFEITWWFIREWADDRKEYDHHSGSNYGRRVRRVQRNTIRDGGGKFARNPESHRSKYRAWLAANGHADSNGVTVNAGISPDHGAESALSGQNGQPGQGRTVSLGNGQESALTGQDGQRGQGRGVSPDTADESALTRLNGQPGQGAAMPGLVPLQTVKGEVEEEPSKRSTVVNAQKAGRGHRRINPENMFLLDVGAMMERWRKGSSKGELTNSGAWWRMAFRADPDLMGKVLADTLSAVKESRIKTTPGQHAVDLWKRWDGKLAEKEAR